MKMTRSEVVYLLLGILCVMQISKAAPVTDVRDGNNIVDEIIMKLKQLKQQSEGNEKSVCVCPVTQKKTKKNVVCR